MGGLERCKLEEKNVRDAKIVVLKCLKPTGGRRNLGGGSFRKIEVETMKK